MATKGPAKGPQFLVASYQEIHSMSVSSQGNPFLQSKEESIKHAMFECTWAKNFWHHLKQVSSVKIPELHPTTWAMDIIDSSTVSTYDVPYIFALSKPGRIEDFLWINYVPNFFVPCLLNGCNPFV